VSSSVLLEVCIDSVASAVAAEAGGGGRVELCADLGVGGTTPSIGTIAECCRRVAIPVNVIIRPRGGDFVFSEEELDVMRADVIAARAAGASGIVIGSLLENGAVDRQQTRTLVEAARPLPVTFHRAFDEVADQAAALETLIELGVDRVLTSGGAPTAEAGIASLAALVRQAGDRIVILAGGTVRPHNVARIVGEADVREVHARLDHPAGTLRRRGPATDEALVRRTVAAANSTA
jgi:copper homeostasis protein